MSTPTSVLLLGAYGLAGSSILGALADRGLSVTAAGGNAHRLDRVVEAVQARRPDARIQTAVLDLSDEEALRRVLSRTRIVINSVGPYLDHGARIAALAVETGVHYIDIASEQEHYRRLKRLNDVASASGVLVGIGFGLYPGVSGILARRLLPRLEKPERVALYLAMGSNPQEEGTAQLLTGILELTTRLEETRGGRLVRYTPSRTVPADFGHPFGAREVMVWPQLEVLALSRLYGLDRAESGLYAAGQTRPTRLHAAGVRLLAPQKRPRSRRYLLRLLQNMTESSTIVPDGAALYVRAEGSGRTVTTRLYAPDTERATAVLPVRAAEKLLSERDGTAARGSCAAVEWFADEDIVADEEWVEQGSGGT